MQINSKSLIDTSILLGSFGKSESFSISQSPEFFEVLSKNLYSNPLQAVIRETITNAYDANLENQSDKPIQVIFTDEYEFIVKDNGKGIEPEKIRDIYCTYGSSTKTDTVLTGGFGLGCKSPFALVSNFVVENNYQGTKYIYTLSKDTGVPTITLISSIPTDDTGLKVTIPLGSCYKIEEAQTYAVFLIRLGGMKNVEFKNFTSFQETRILNGFDYPYDLNFIVLHEPEHNLQELNIPNHSNILIKYGNNVFPLDTKEFNLNILELVKRNIYDSIAHYYNRKLYKDSLHYKLFIVIPVPNNSIDILPSREGLRYTDKTKNTITSILDKADKELTDIVATDMEGNILNDKVKEYITNNLETNSSYIVSKRTLSEAKENTALGLQDIYEDIFPCFSSVMEAKFRFSVITLNWLMYADKYSNVLPDIYKYVFRGNYNSYKEHQWKLLLTTGSFRSTNFSGEVIKFLYNKFTSIKELIGTAPRYSNENKVNISITALKRLKAASLDDQRTFVSKLFTGMPYTQGSPLLRDLPICCLAFAPIILLVPRDINRINTHLSSMSQYLDPRNDYPWINMENFIYVTVKSKEQNDLYRDKLIEAGYQVISFDYYAPAPEPGLYISKKTPEDKLKDFIKTVKTQYPSCTIVYKITRNIKGNDVDPQEIQKIFDLREAAISFPSVGYFSDRIDATKQLNTSVGFPSLVPMMRSRQGSLETEYKTHQLFPLRDVTYRYSFEWEKAYEHRMEQMYNLKIYEVSNKTMYLECKKQGLISYEQFFTNALRMDINNDPTVQALIYIAHLIKWNQRRYSEGVFPDVLINTLWLCLSIPAVCRRYNLPKLSLYQTNLLSAGLVAMESSDNNLTSGLDPRTNPLALRLVKKLCVIPKTKVITDGLLCKINEVILDTMERYSFEPKDKKFNSFDLNLIFSVMDIIFGKPKGAN